MKKDVALWIVTVLFSIVFLAMFGVAMIEKWGFGVIAWLAVGGIDYFLIQHLFKKAAPARPGPTTKKK